MIAEPHGVAFSLVVVGAFAPIESMLVGVAGLVMLVADDFFVVVADLLWHVLLKIG